MCEYDDDNSNNRWVFFSLLEISLVFFSSLARASAVSFPSLFCLIYLMNNLIMAVARATNTIETLKRRGGREMSRETKKEKKNINRPRHILPLIALSPSARFSFAERAPTGRMAKADVIMPEHDQ